MAGISFHLINIMYRKFTAMAFILVMAMAITLKHPVLGYCLCVDAYFTGDCQCQAEQAAKPTVNESSSSNCANCCGVETVAKNQPATENKPSTSSLPCDDCVKQLVVEVGDYVWHGSDQLPADSEFPIPHLPFALADLSWSSHLTFYAPMSIRGDPPPGLHDSDIPHYLSHSVMRL
jgi:hypothetical protein